MSKRDSMDDLLNELEDLGIEVEKDLEPSKPRAPRSPAHTPSPPRRSAVTGGGGGSAGGGYDELLDDLEGDDWDVPAKGPS